MNKIFDKRKHRRTFELQGVTRWNLRLFLESELLTKCFNWSLLLCSGGPGGPDASQSDHQAESQHRGGPGRWTFRRLYHLQTPAGVGPRQPHRGAGVLHHQTATLWLPGERAHRCVSSYWTDAWRSVRLNPVSPSRRRLHQRSLHPAGRGPARRRVRPPGRRGGDGRQLPVPPHRPGRKRGAAWDVGL